VGKTLPDPSVFLETLCFEDLSFVEALVRGNGKAWQRFDALLLRIVAQVSSRFRNTSSKRILEDLRQEIMGLFYLDGKVLTYRASAPLEAWVRQVVFNHWRRAVKQESGEKRIHSLDQTSEGHDAPRLIADPKAAPPDHRMDQREWASALARAIPEAMKSLDRDERRMLELLPSKKLTQLEMAEELKVSPFKMSRWYKEVRERFQKSLTRELRRDLAIEEAEISHLMEYLAELWTRGAEP
jgi:RNA polymerase sigma factor (sigma-70 family)